MRWRGFRSLKDLLILFVARFRKPKDIPYLDCAHCWGSYPGDYITLSEIPVIAAEMRNMHDTFLNRFKITKLENIPICIFCKELPLIAEQVIFYPHGHELYWKDPEGGAMYRCKKPPKDRKLPRAKKKKKRNDYDQ